MSMTTFTKPTLFRLLDSHLRWLMPTSIFHDYARGESRLCVFSYLGRLLNTRVRVNMTKSIWTICWLLCERPAHMASHVLSILIRMCGHEGGKAMFVGAPDADIVADAIEILRKRIAAGTATFLVTWQHKSA